MDGDGRVDLVRGIREFVVGTGGAAFTGTGARQLNSEVLTNTDRGVLKFGCCRNWLHLGIPTVRRFDVCRYRRRHVLRQVFRKQADLIQTAHHAERRSSTVPNGRGLRADFLFVTA